MSFQKVLKARAGVVTSMAATAEPPIWLKDGDEKAQAVRAMFDSIAPSYDRINALMSLRLHHRWRAYAVSLLRLPPGAAALDLCSGTGDFLLPLRQAIGQEGRLVALDFSSPMLARASSKDRRAVLTIGDACRVPAADGSFQGVSVGWGIRNVRDIDQAHREAMRVLAPGGRFVSIDCALPQAALPRFIAHMVGKHVLPWVGRLFGNRTAYTYLPESTIRFWDRDRLATSMRQAGFVDVYYMDLFFGNVSVHFGSKP